MVILIMVDHGKPVTKKFQYGKESFDCGILDTEESNGTYGNVERRAADSDEDGHKRCRFLRRESESLQ